MVSVWTVTGFLLLMLMLKCHSVVAAFNGVNLALGLASYPEMVSYLCRDVCRCC